MNEKRWYGDYSDWDDIRRASGTLSRYLQLKTTEKIERICPSEDMAILYEIAKMMAVERDGRDIVMEDGSIAVACDSSIDLTHDYLWNRLGCPRWFIDMDTAAVLAKTEIDEDLTGVRWPYDSFKIIFEHGMRTSTGVPLRSVQISYPHSDLARAIIDEVGGWSEDSKILTGKYGLVSVSEMIKFRCDCCERSDGSFNDKLTPGAGYKSWDVNRTLAHPPTMNTLNGSEHETIHEAVKIAVSAVLYWNARPEFIADYAIPRSSRYQFKRREHCKRVTLPVEKIIRPRRDDRVSDGGTKSPHFRGFVLRTLRSECYKRNDDGTLRVILVPPCAIHPELMEKV